MSGTTSGFGQSAFGQTTGLGGAAAPAFGQSTGLGGAAAPAFGQSTGLGGGTGAVFGQSTGLGGGTGAVFGQSTGLGGGAPAFGQSTGLGGGAPAFGVSGGLGTNSRLLARGPGSKGSHVDRSAALRCEARRSGRGCQPVVAVGPGSGQRPLLHGCQVWRQPAQQVRALVWTRWLCVHSS